ncbi:hypothetical protein [Cyclobacterium lianum]|nr:hypothetical protein [Cyclobacterium lianum]
MDQQQVMERLDGVTRRVNFLETVMVPPEESILFNGDLKSNQFTISKKIDKADSFLPLIKGKVSPLAKGCLISLDYSFFPATVFFLSFWGVVSFLLTVLFLAVFQDWKLAALSTLAGIGNYGFAIWHFRRKVKESQLLFYDMMDMKAGRGAP